MTDQPTSGTPAAGGAAALPWPAAVVGAVLAVILMAPILLFFNVVTASGAVAAVRLVVQDVSGTRVPGVVTESRVEQVRSRWGRTSRPRESYCYGRFDSDAGEVRQRLVRIYTDDGCSRATGSAATLVPGAGWPEPGDARSSLRLDGIFGMTDGAAVGRPHAFWRSLWPYLFLAPFTALVDASALYGVRSAIAVLRARRRRSGPETTGAPPPVTDDDRSPRV